MEVGSYVRVRESYWDPYLIGQEGFIQTMHQIRLEEGIIIGVAKVAIGFRLCWICLDELELVGI